jgi:hypothetical protein
LRTESGSHSEPILAGQKRPVGSRQ